MAALAQDHHKGGVCTPMHMQLVPGLLHYAIQTIFLFGSTLHACFGGKDEIASAEAYKVDQILQGSDCVGHRE